MIKGSCLCGRVVFRVNGSMSKLSNCHCSECRKAYGAAFGTIAVCKLEDFEYCSGDQYIKKFIQSERVTRYFCTECGSPLPIREDWDPLVGVPAGLLNDDPSIRPSEHIFVESKAPWWEITDNIPQFEEWSEESDPAKRTDISPPSV